MRGCAPRLEHPRSILFSQHHAFNGMDESTTIMRLRRPKMTHKYPHLHSLNLTQQCRRHLPVHRIQTPTIQAAPRERSNYRLRHTFRRHTQSVSAGNFSPDGSLLASCGASALCVCLGFLYAWSCSRFVICFATCHQSMVAFHRRTNPQPQWAYEGSLGHLVVERWDIPCFRIGRYEYTNSMERRNCTFVSTTHVSLMEMMGGLPRARQQNIYGVTQTSCSALCTKLTLVGVVAGTIVDNGETNPTIDLVRQWGRHVGVGCLSLPVSSPPPLEQRASSIPSRHIQRCSLLPRPNIKWLFSERWLWRCSRTDSCDIWS